MNKATIYYRDIGDYLTREEKLAIIHRLGSVDNPDMQWQTLTPNGHNDWINHRNNRFAEFIPLAPGKKFDAKTKSFFNLNVIAVSSNRDAWVYNFSKQALAKDMRRMIGFYNEQSKAFTEAKQNNPALEIEKFIDTDEKKISWTRALRNNAKKGIILDKKEDYRVGIYRPFCSQYLYYDDALIESPGLSRKLFPLPDMENLVICITGIGASKPFSVLISDKITSIDTIEKNQCFPLYWYEETKQEKTLFDCAAEPESGYYARRDAVSDFILGRAREQYGSKTAKEDIFYYVYGLLHNPDYRAAFAADLKKMLPRLPLIDSSSDFWKYVKAGRELAALHLHYEDYAHEAGVKVEINNAVYDNYEITKMRFPSKGDKSRIIYNPYITVANIPAEAYEYVVNGKSAIEWIMERYQVSTHKESGIVNDPNDWAREQGKPEYILDLLLSVIAVSVKTVGIVKGLPEVDFEKI